MSLDVVTGLEVKEGAPFRGAVSLPHSLKVKAVSAIFPEEEGTGTGKGACHHTLECTEGGKDESPAE